MKCVEHSWTSHKITQHYANLNDGRCQKVSQYFEI